MESTLSLQEILLILKKRLKLIIFITLFGFGITALITNFLLTPMYETASLLLVNSSKSNGETSQTNEASSNRDLINTYSVIITTPRILEEVVKELSLNSNHNELRKRVTVESEKDSHVLSITVKYEDPMVAMNIANTIATIFQKEINVIMNVDNVSILSVAEIPQTPISPKPMLNMTIAFVVSFMISLGLSFILEVLDNRIQKEEDIEKSLGVPLLGTVMSIDIKKRKFNIVADSYEMSRKQGKKQIGR